MLKERLRQGWRSFTFSGRDVSELIERSIVKEPKNSLLLDGRKLTNSRREAISLYGHLNFFKVKVSMGR